ncbi:MAG: tetratricopeptide repeat protein, partial [Candidatus Electrothrix sp. AR5]|nr:tetratricopeptide repeat protein [Candidatus Electrothrix sp. AR5]
AGGGKTTLAKGFLHWLRDTGGLDQQFKQQIFWFSFDEIRSAEYVINQLVDGIFGTEALATPLEQKLAGLIKVFREHSFLLVWDNFESASGLADTEVRPMLSEDDRGLLKELLAGLRGGKTKVLITSRSVEKWLSTGECFRLPLSGLRGEELWAFCNQVLRDLGLTVKRGDEDFLALIKELDGHPLALRAVLLQLKDKGAKELLADLRKEFALLEGDESSKRILAALAVLDQGLPEEYGPVLQLIGLHRRFVDQNYLKQMLEHVDITTVLTWACFALLESAGLIQALGRNIFHMHTALQSHLEQHHPAGESLKHTFVDFMSIFADDLAPKELYEQRIPFALYQGNFHHALNLAHHLDMKQYFAPLTQSLAAYAENNRDYTSAEQLFRDLAEHHREKKKYEDEARAYHHLGIIVQKQRDFSTAEQWYKKSLAIFEEQGYEHGAASSYHQLGIIAEEQRDFSTAEQWHKKSLAIEEKQANEHGIASSYHQLGRLAEEQRDFSTAEQWYKKSLAIEEKQANEHGVARNYHHLGIIAQKQRDFSTAEQWHKKSLAIEEKQGNEHGVASSYHQLGRLAEEQRNFSTAEQWYKKSLAIKERQNNEFGAANTYAQLGLLAGKMKELTDAGHWLLKAIQNFAASNDEHNTNRAMEVYVDNLQAANSETQTLLRQQWQQAGLNEIITLDQLEQQLNEQN